MIFDPKILAKILNTDNQPFFRKEDDKLYMKYTSINLTNNKHKTGIISSYLWKGEKLFTQEASGITFSNSNSLTIEAPGELEIFLKLE